MKLLRPSFPASLLFLALCHLLLANAHSPEADRQALLCLRSGLAGADGSAAAVLATWRRSSSQSFCRWRGVSCASASRVVAALDLRSLNLTGSIPPCIGNLTSLTSIDLSDNLIGGGIPPEIGRLTELSYLNLSNNALVGAIPATLAGCSRLETLSLWSNLLEGEIPPSLGRCSSLREIALSHNNLHGRIPSEFSMLPNLSLIYLSSNHLSGAIPPLLGCSPNLTDISLRRNTLTGGIPSCLLSSSEIAHLDLALNSLSGEIPVGLFNSSVLSYIDLSRNNFSGPIPGPGLYHESSPLEFLSLAGNNLSGSIPSSLGNLSSLFSLLLGLNNLQGTIPESLGNMTSLQQLGLTYNSLSGPVPPEIYRSPSLAFLGLGANRLSGTIPSNIGHTLPRLESLVLHGNQFDGHIPTSLVNASNLQVLDLGNNTFTGVIPSLWSLTNLFELNLAGNLLEAGDWTFFSSLSNSTQLQRLYLHANNLQGALPISIGNLPKTLQQLYLNNNQITGTLSLGIGNLTSLTLLYLQRNFISGHIPVVVGNLQNLFVLSLADNKFSGEIPQTIGNLQKLTELYLQNNMLSGSIPASFANCKSLNVVNLSCNSFHGSIPQQILSISSLAEGLDLSYNQLAGPIPELTSLINLEILNLSNNQLSGRIPSSLGDCLHLEYLHLEANYLQGSIPGSLMNLRGMVEMALSQNNLSGEIPEFLESFSSLQLLNLSFNNFQGPVPTSGTFGISSQVFVQGNKDLCSNSPALELQPCAALTCKRSRILYVAATVPAVVVVLVSLSTALAIIYKRRKATKQLKSQPSEEMKRFSYHDLFKATSGFSCSNLIGVGRYGAVYRGAFVTGPRIAAIKVFKLDQDGASKSFIDECKALRNTRHRNLVSVISVCSTFDPTGSEFKALVLEHMSNGNLESWLHPEEQKYGANEALSFELKVSIAADIAAALDYLHNQCTPPVVHCDLKPSNVLLDNDMSAHVGDFGLAKFLYNPCSSTSLVGPRGSIGYIAPEYGIGSKMSIEGDTYSYGIILLEILTGKNPTDEMFHDGLSLRRFVELAFPDKIADILDPNLVRCNQAEHRNTCSDKVDHIVVAMQSCAIQLTVLGLKCSSESPKDRPTMDEVYTEVASIKKTLLALCK